MQKFFDGKAIRDKILKNIANQNAKKERLPHLAVILAGDNPVCQKYVELKQKSAEKVGITFSVYKFNEHETNENVVSCIEHLNHDEEIDGIMIQIPVDKKFDRDSLIKSISPRKDVDGLRYCLGLDSDYRPPVVEAIFQSLIGNYQVSSIKYLEGELKDKKLAIIGEGFLVGRPLLRALKEIEDLKVDTFNENCKLKIENYDILVSATGKAGLIRPDMVKENVVLIDAGTAEENGELKGDIDPECYKKASYYTPVPGGIGPVTIAMLFQNLVGKY